MLLAGHADSAHDPASCDLALPAVSLLHGAAPAVMQGLLQVESLRNDSQVVVYGLMWQHNIGHSTIRVVRSQAEAPLRE